MKKNEAANIRGRLADGTPNPIDRHVGVRIRLRRCMLGLSQEKLAEELGITFQQVQKYEKGLNRVGASRLWDLSQVLGVPVDFFYMDMDESSRRKSPRNISSGLEVSEDEIDAFNLDILGRKDITDLIRFYDNIRDTRVCKSVIDLLKSLSRSPGNKAPGALTDEEEDGEAAPAFYEVHE